MLIFAAPGTGEAFACDRTAVLHGEWWRLWTGHWVHFSASHLFWNLAVLLVAGPWLEQLRPGLLLRYTLIAAPLISLALLTLEPALQTYGGLSGLAMGVVVLLAAGQLSRRNPDSAWWLALLALVAGKITFDAGHDTALFSRFAATDIRPSALAHAAGAGLALAVFLSRQTVFCRPIGSATP